MMAGIMNQPYGDVPKWLKGADSKSARRRKACGGSNPSISAITDTVIDTIVSVTVSAFLYYFCENWGKIRTLQRYFAE